jgi:hypothetical protein
MFLLPAQAGLEQSGQQDAQLPESAAAAAASGADMQARNITLPCLLVALQLCTLYIVVQCYTTLALLPAALACLAGSAVNTGG